jgi:translation initiation factor IF-3
MRIHRHRLRTPKIAMPKYLVNEQIQAPILRVIDEKGIALGEISRKEALEKAEERELDLVEVSPKADPPVAKLLEYGAFKYQKEKEIRKQRAQSKEVEIKGIRLSVRISEHDRQIRLEQAKKFLDRGDKVRMEINLRGREKAYPDLALEAVSRFLQELKSVFSLRVEQEVKKQGSSITAIVTKS